MKSVVDSSLLHPQRVGGVGQETVQQERKGPFLSTPEDKHFMVELTALGTNFFMHECTPGFSGVQ